MKNDINILITGVNGFLGRSLKHYIERGIDEETIKNYIRDHRENYTSTKQMKFWK